MKLYRTSNMEGAIALLANQYKHVMVRASYRLEKQIHLRPERFAPMQAYYQLINGPLTQLETWKEKGGVLVYFRDDHLYENCDAIVMVECPYRTEELYHHAGSARHVAVIYRPPTWTHHREETVRMNPDADMCRPVYETIMEQRGNEHPIKEAICKKSGFGTDYTALIEDDEHCKAAGMDKRHLTICKTKILHFTNKPYTFQTFKVRIEPEDMALMPTYKYLENDTININGLRVAASAELCKTAAFHKKAVRLLTACGSVERIERFSLYNCDVIHPHWDWIDKRHRVHMLKVDAVINAVDGLPEFS